MLFGQGKRVGEQDGERRADGAGEEGAHVADDRVDLALNRASRMARTRNVGMTNPFMTVAPTAG